MKRSARTQDRVSEARKRLVSEFGHTVPPETIEAVIEDQLSRWEDAPVQAYIPVLTERIARQRLRELARSQRAG
ncbi:MAG: three-helix bundle dimerization domain-containing protein [Actinomycetota bacterium]